MESLGNGRQVMEGGLDGSSIRERLRRRLDQWFRAAVIGLLGLLLLAGCLVHAQSTRYVYDADGRVVAVTANNGTSVQYGYNTLGHASQVSAPLSSGQLAIFSFMPTHGEAGTQVTLQGQGFDSNAANDTVSFNGTVATVLSASSTQLVTSVPNGATTGPISVTVAGKTATSAIPFVIDDSGLPPSITQLSPLLVSVGASVTVTGTHLDPVAGYTRVQMGGRDVPTLSGVSDTQLQYAVPADGATGYVTVETPYGHATSSTQVIILPSGVSASNVVSTGSATVNGAAATLNIGASGQVGAMTFEAPQNGWVSLQATGITTAASSISYTVYGPGNAVVQQGNMSAGSPSIHLPRLMAGITYVALFTPSGAGAQLTVGAESDALLASGTPVTVVTATAYASKRVLVQAAQGANLDVALSGLTNPGASGNGVQVSVLNAAGTQVGTVNCFPSNPGGACNVNLWSLAAGIYSVVVVPTNGGTLNFNAVMWPDLVEPAIALNSTVKVALPEGQVARYSFNANAGDSVALNVSSLVTTPSGQNFNVLVFRPDAGTITTSTSTYATITTSGSQTINLPNLPVSGTYTVIVGSWYALPATAHLTVAGGPPGHVSGASQTYATSVAGQNAYLSFTATQGENLDLALSNLTNPGASGNGVQVTVFNAAGTQVGSVGCFPSNPGGACNVNLWNLAAGNYSVTVVPSNGGTLAFNAVLLEDLVEPAIALNSTVNIALPEGQVARYSFNANAGDTVALNLSNLTTTPSGQKFNVLVFRPDVGVITTSTPTYTMITTTGSQTINLPNLPVSGAYTVIVGSWYALPATAQLSLVGGSTGSVAPSQGASQSYTASVAGQNVYLTFNANTGDNLELTLNNINVAGASTNGFQVNVYDPNGTNVAGYSCYASNPGASCREPLFNLVAGTYSVIVSPTWGGTLSFGAILEPDTVGPVLVAGSPMSINLAEGQVIRATFNANAGGTVALALSGVSSTSPTGQPLWVTIYRPGAVTTTNGYNGFSATSSSTLNLSNLPTTGTYTATIYTVYGTPATGQLSFSSQ
ncbi:pre-peptidase C-terminal domain-containing protein [Burkholderia pseudomallei]|uniref:pre-peptidase C-terminal domain-containing protein n=1 Tax=Burkholderia pseudomallei TaxID=28450 RepID=UPI0027DF864F|nr:pre-peptidase C-terminal domain-containing protein [Burkholderia pseudomallei]